MATMIVPGFVSQLRTVFPKPGVYQVICNEFCGVGHDYMWSQLTVVPKADWKG
jgi:cytochrome c oxidase subunit II